MSINEGPSGININDKYMNLVMGWFVINKDNTFITEDDISWDKLKKSEIKILGLKWHDKVWTIRDKTAWVQFKRGSVAFSTSGVSDDIDCVERCIGYYEGPNKVIYRVNNRTGQMKPEVVSL
jgi:hypothetical protein